MQHMPLLAIICGMPISMNLTLHCGTEKNYQVWQMKICMVINKNMPKNSSRFMSHIFTFTNMAKFNQENNHKILGIGF